MLYILAFCLTCSVGLNIYTFLTQKKKPKLDPRALKLAEAVRNLDREGQTFINLEVVNQDDVFLRSRGRA